VKPKGAASPFGRLFATGPAYSAIAACAAAVLAFQGPDRITSKHEAIAALKKMGATLRFDRMNEPIWLGFGNAVRMLDDAKLACVASLDRLEEIDFAPSATIRGGKAELAEHPLVTDKGLMHLRGLSRLRALKLVGTGIKGPGLTQLWENKELKTLNLSNLSLQDQGLKYVAGFKELEDLNIRYCDIQGDGLIHISRLTKLRTLHFASQSINAAGIGHLSRMNDLQALYLGIGVFGPATNINLRQPADIGFLREFTRLTVLSLNGMPIRSAQLDAIAGLDKLEHLDLGDTEIDDSGLRQIAGLSNLWQLNLTGTRITDAGLIYLTNLSKCSSIRLAGTHVTERGLVPRPR
jgi:Leucine rich repeat/Leucine Rich repeat